MMADPAFLRSIDLFADMDDADVEAVIQRAQLRRYPTDATIFSQGDSGSRLYIVHEGRVKIVLYAEDGRETMIAIMSPGDFLGEMSVLDGEPRSAAAVALEPVSLWYVGRDDFLACLAERPRLALKIITLLTRRLRQTDEQVADLVFFDVFSRVAKRLLELAETHGEPTESGTAISLSMTQQDFANLVGASREMVNKAFKLYRARGYLSISKQRITVHDPDGLREHLEAS
ncbi:MAG: hypothetical protein CL878_13695 [Dehalococcoidia bacterium]|nr:hypothetical protein [Dehalococcoidia bacterium]